MDDQEDQEQPRRVPPHSTAAERALLGSWLLSRDARAHQVDPADFYHRSSGRLAGAIMAMAAAGDPIDVVTVVDHLERAGQLDAVGGPATLTSLIADTPVTGHAARYAAIIRRDAHHRRLLLAAAELTDALYSLDDDGIAGALERIRLLQAAVDPAGRGKVVQLVEGAA